MASLSASPVSMLSSPMPIAVSVGRRRRSISSIASSTRNRCFADLIAPKWHHELALVAADMGACRRAAAAGGEMKHRSAAAFALVDVPSSPPASSACRPTVYFIGQDDVGAHCWHVAASPSRRMSTRRRRAFSCLTTAISEHRWPPALSHICSYRER